MINKSMKSLMILLLFGLLIPPVSTEDDSPPFPPKHIAGIQNMLHIIPVKPKIKKTISRDKLCLDFNMRLSKGKNDIWKLHVNLDTSDC